jgi:hypothetical protein
MNVIQDRVMTPLVAQMAIFSAIESTERSVGASTYSIRGRAEFEGGSVKLDNTYSGDVNVAALASLGVATPLAYALNSGFDAFRLKNIALEITPLDTRNQAQIADVAAPRQVRPGDDLDISVVLTGANGADTVKRARYHVPVGAPTGPLYITVSDASTANLTDVQAAYSSPAHSASQVLGLLNGLRPNTSAYVRIWRSDNSFSVDGRDLPDPPASISLILGKSQAPGLSLLNARGAQVAELEITAGETVVTGSKTVQVEVKE